MAHILAQIAPSRGFGYHQYCNFGQKHKNLSYYDIANKCDYAYLRWCLNYDPIDKKTGQRKQFFISDTCFPHIRAALGNEKSKVPWNKIYSEPDPEGKMVMKYVSKDENDQEISGPDIEMKFCIGCSKIKSYLLFTEGNHDLCRVCYHRRQTMVFKRQNEKFNPNAEKQYNNNNNNNYSQFHWPKQEKKPYVYNKYPQATIHEDNEHPENQK